MTAPPNPSTRSRTIRKYVAEAGELMAEAKRTRDRIRVLGSKIKADLAMDPSDFMIAVRMHQLAEKGQRHRVEDVREVLLALGDAIPRMVDQASSRELEPFVGAPIKREIINALQEGPALTSELRQRNYNLRHLTSLNTHLSQLLSSGAVQRDGEGKWNLAASSSDGATAPS